MSRSTTTRWSAYTGALLLLAVVCLSSTVAAQSFGCTASWGGPSADNSVVDCIISDKAIKQQWPKFLFIGFAGLAFVIIVFILPCVCCCCCCGEQNKNANKSSKVQGLLLAGFAITGCVCVCIFLVCGGVSFNNSFIQTVDDINSGPVNYINNTANEIELYLTDFSVDPPKQPNIDLGEFNSLSSDISNNVHDVKDTVPTIAVLLVSVLLGLLFLALVLLAMVSLLCNCRKCACACGWLYYLLAVFFSLLAIAMAVASFVVGGLCGEVVLQERREPGLFQWYLVPYFQKTFDFDSIREDVNQEVRDAGVAACTELLKLCGPVATEDKPFVCGDNLVVASSCTTIDSVVRAVTGTYMNEKYTALGCPAPNGESDWKCYLSECRTECTAEELREAAGTAVDKAAFAANASTALSFVEPILESNYVVDLVVSVLEARKTSPLAAYSHGDVARCSNLVVASNIVAVGFFLGSLMLLFGLWILLKARGDEEATEEPEKVANPVSAN